jgi:ABC-2 type transport system permease protein
MADPAFARRWWSAAAAVAHHDLVGLSRDGRMRLGLAVTLFLAAAAAASGTIHHNRLARERGAARLEEQRRWEGQPAKDSHDATHYGQYVFKPPAPLAVLDRGIESFVGVGVWLEAHRTNLLRHRPIEDATSVSRFGELTATLILQVLCPLLIVLGGHGLVAAERENGTLRQLLLAGTSPGAVMAGKGLALVGGGLVLAVPLMVLGSGLGLIEGLEPSALDRLAVLLAAHGAYLAGWMALTLAVSAWCRTSRAALLLLLTLWFAGAVLGPRLAGVIVGRLAPVPSHIAFRIALDAEIGPHSAERVAARKARILDQYGVSRTEDLPIDWRGISLQEEEERTSDIYERHLAGVTAIHRAQRRLLQWAGFLLPALAVQAISQTAAGTDLEHLEVFTRAAEAQRREIQRLMNADITAHAREGIDYKADPRLWATVPRFVPPRPSLVAMLPSVSIAVVALCFWMALTTGAAGLATRRLHP